MYNRSVMSDDPRLDDFVTALEDFNTVFIRLAEVNQLSLSTLSVLHTLSRRGPLRLTDLVRTERLKQPAMTSLVAKLEEQALVVRRPDPSDGRSALISLTPHGERIVTERHSDRVRNLAPLVAELDAEDRRALASMTPVFQRLASVAGAGARRPEAAAVADEEGHR